MIIDQSGCPFHAWVWMGFGGEDEPVRPRTLTTFTSLTGTLEESILLFPLLLNYRDTICRIIFSLPLALFVLLQG